jgi:hypothetical protein
LLSSPYFGQRPFESSSRHSAIAPRKLSGVIGRRTFCLEEEIDDDAASWGGRGCWWCWDAFATEVIAAVNKRARRAREVVVKDEEARPPALPLRRGLALILLFVSSSSENT